MKCYLVAQRFPFTFFVWFSPHFSCCRTTFLKKFWDSILLYLNEIEFYLFTVIIFLITNRVSSFVGHERYRILMQK